MPLQNDSFLLEERQPASYLRQAIIGFIDVAIVLTGIVLLLIFQIPKPLYVWIAPINTSLLALIALILYRLVTLVVFGSTVGMKICKVVLLNGEQDPLSIKEKVLASVFILYQGVAYYRETL